MQQYYRFKKRHPDCILLFRIGDFYEMFDDDAVTASKAIGLTLTQRTEGVPMAGLPFHQLESYLRKFISRGFRVAVCDQLIDSSQVKGVIPRGVTRVITPGTLVDESLLENDAVNRLCAINFTESGDESGACLAVVEASTGSFTLLECSHATIVDELARRAVKEVLYADTANGKAPPRVKRILDSLGLAGTPRPAWQFRHEEARDCLRDHYKVATLAGFGMQDDDPTIAAAGAILKYLIETQAPANEAIDSLSASSPSPVPRATLAHLRPPSRDDNLRCCVIDAVSLRSLEIERTIRPAAPGGSAGDGSLVGIFLNTPTGSVVRTPMGKRLLREWLCRPLCEEAAIEARLNIVSTFVEDQRLGREVGESLSHVQDIARIAGRLGLARASPRDLVGLAVSLRACERTSSLIANTPSLDVLRSTLETHARVLIPLTDAILTRCVDDPPAHLREGGLFRDGVDPSLDAARLMQRDAGSWLAEYQNRLISQHGLPGLKVGFNRVFGYYIELPAAQARNAPPELIRSQTLRNAERFTTTELRTFEGQVTTAEARAIEREKELFGDLCSQAAAIIPAISACSEAIAELDVLLGFAEKAIRRGWRRPRITHASTIRIDSGRHPVLDELLDGGFVPNDLLLGATAMSSTDTSSIAAGPTLALITGPNMAGKSTFIRQTALIAILAHAGSFVPADHAEIGMIDRVFTRIGADDALHAGQSTFMVEMIETANILNHVTGKSLVVLDEIGRGTSTLDGLSLAWAIAEFLSGDEKRAGPRTLFATHYHELTSLEERSGGKVTNLHVAVREWPPGDPHAQIVFLHRILPGRTDKSYGVQVARLAGLPSHVVARARDVLASLSVSHSAGADASSMPRVGHRSDANEGGQMSLFTEYVNHPAVDAIREIKLDTMTPVQAFDMLRKLHEMVEHPR